MMHTKLAITIVATSSMCMAGGLGLVVLQQRLCGL